MENQVMEYASGNEMAALAIKQIGYDLMGYYPITPSTDRKSTRLNSSH